MSTVSACIFWFTKNPKIDTSGQTATFGVILFYKQLWHCSFAWTNFKVSTPCWNLCRRHPSAPLLSGGQKNINKQIILVSKSSQKCLCLLEMRVHRLHFSLWEDFSQIFWTRLFFGHEETQKSSHQVLDSEKS